MREHGSFLRRLEETFRRDLHQARRAVREAGRADLARARASVEDLKRDYDVPPPHTALTEAELKAFRRHLRTAARLMRELSNLDSPGWNEANEEYERSWADVERARSEGASASP